MLQNELNTFAYPLIDENLKKKKKKHTDEEVRRRGDRQWVERDMRSYPNSYPQGVTGM